MALDTLSPVVHLGQFVQLSQPGKLGNVYGPGGGYAHSPLGGALFHDLVDQAGDPVADELAALATAAAQATTQTVGSGVADPNAPANAPGSGQPGGQDIVTTGDGGPSGDGSSDGGAGAGSAD